MPSPFEDQIPAAAKSTTVAYMLAVLLGAFGAHRFYLDRPISGLLMLAAGLIPAAALLDPTPGPWKETLEDIVAVGIAAVTIYDMTQIAKWTREINGISDIRRSRKTRSERGRPF